MRLVGSLLTVLARRRRDHPGLPQRRRRHQRRRPPSGQFVIVTGFSGQFIDYEIDPRFPSDLLRF
jgi:hypothetical protein